MNKLFGTDGIRGIAGQFPLMPEFVEKIGYTAVNTLRERITSPVELQVLIGRDTRISGEEIFNALAEGITDAGSDVIDLGIFPTPGVAYITKQKKVLAGIVISASHNPWEFNGIKFFSSQGIKLPDEIEEEIENELRVTSYELRVKKQGSIAKDKKAKDEYLSYLRNTVPVDFNLTGIKLVVDCANGALYEFAPELFAHFGAEKIVLLNTQPDGKNINKNCGSLYLDQLCEIVKKTNADLGFAFDGDGDRVLFSDEFGNPVDGDQLMCLLAEEWKNRSKLSRCNIGMVVTQMSNFGLYELMQEKGIKIHTVSVGDRYVWEGMQEKKASLGGEQSGHIIFSEFSTTGDGLITALQILKIYQEKGLPFSKLFKMVKYPQVLLNVPVKVRKDLDTLPAVKEVIKQGEKELKHKGRIFVRYSGTEPLLRILVEGKEEKQIRKIVENIVLVAKKELK